MRRLCNTTSKVKISAGPHRQGIPPHARRAPLTGIATIYSKLGNHREALHYYRKVLEVSRKIGDWPDVVATLRRLAVTHEILREFPEALVCYQEALQVSRDLGDRQEERTILATMAHLYRQQLRDFHAALPCYQQSLALWEETGEEAGRQALLKGLGATCWNLGRYEEAAAAFEQALQIVEAAGDQAEQAAVRSSLGVVSGNLRRYATALAHLREGLAIAKAMADLRAQGYILNALGNVYYEIGDQRHGQGLLPAGGPAAEAHAGQARGGVELLLPGPRPWRGGRAGHCPRISGAGAQPGHRDWGYRVTGAHQDRPRGAALSPGRSRSR